MKYWTKTEISFLSILLALFVTAALLLIKNLREKIEASTAYRVGSVMGSQRRVERKYADMAVWTSLYLDAPIYNRDTVRTAAASAASLRLENGIKIDISEETMILVDLTQAKSIIDVSGGTVVVSRSAPRANATDTVTVRTTRAEVILEKGAVALNDNDKQLRVAVREGEAILELDSGSSRLGGNETATIQDQKYIDMDPAPIPITPPHDAELYTAEELATVYFDWIGSLDFTGELVIAADPDFSSIVGIEKIKGTSLNMKLAIGEYFWRIEGAEGSSSPRRLQIKRLIAPALIDPLPKIIAYRGYSMPLVDLSWLAAYPKTGYILEVSNSPHFIEKAITIQTNGTSVSMTPPSDGEWFWRVRAVYAALGTETATASASFIVARKPMETPVIRGDPTEPILASGLALLSGAFAISWDPVEGADAYSVDVARDAAIKDIVLTRRASANTVRLDGELAPGLYYIAVSVEEADRVSPPSAPRELVITDPEPISLLSPEPGAILPAEAVSFDPLWRDPNGLGRYIIEITAEEDFASVLSKTEAIGIKGTAALPEGVHGWLYWRVARVTDKGSPVLLSPVSRVWKPRLMNKPEIVLPKDNEVIDVFYSDVIDFLWDPVEGASHYLLKLNKMLSSYPIPIREWKVTAAKYSLNDFSVLSEGRFVWDITALSEKDGAIHGSSVKARAYFQIIQSQAVEAPVISVPKVIFVE